MLTQNNNQMFIKRERERERERERGGGRGDGYLPSGKSFSSFLCKSTRCRDVSSEKEEGSS